MVEIKTERKPWIDVLRALAMLFVLYGHMVQESTTFFVFTSPIKIPLFFAITGYLFKDRGGDIKIFFQKLLRTLAIPYLVLAFLPVIAFSLLYGFSYFKEQAIGVLIGESIWYMPCCIIAEIIYFFIRKFLKDLKLLTLAAISCFVFGLLLAKWQILDIFMINRAFVVQIFIYAGYLFRLCENRISKMPTYTFLIGGAAYIGLCAVSMLVFPGQCIDVHKNYYYNVPFCIVLIFVGLFALMSIAKKIGFNKYSGVLTFIGQNTLVYYIWSGYAVIVVNKVLQIVGVTKPFSPIFAIGHTILQCVICGVAAFLLNRFLPEIVGKRRKSRKLCRNATE